MKSEITFTYLEKSFTSRVCWDSVKCIWFIGWIYDKDNFNIFKEPPYILTGKHIQELQAKFEEYIDNYLKQKIMKIEHKGYTLNVEEINGNYRVSCEELYPFHADYSIDYWNINSETIINNFKQKVDSKNNE